MPRMVSAISTPIATDDDGNSIGGGPDRDLVFHIVSLEMADGKLSRRPRQQERDDEGGHHRQRLPDRNFGRANAEERIAEHLVEIHGSLAYIQPTFRRLARNFFFPLQPIRSNPSLQDETRSLQGVDDFPERMQFWRTTGCSSRSRTEGIAGRRLGPPISIRHVVSPLPHPKVRTPHACRLLARQEVGYPVY